MPILSSPGVAIVEKDYSQVVTFNASNNGVVVGDFSRGPIRQPIFVDTVAKLERIFGKPTNANAGRWFTAFNFLQYTNSLWMVRAEPDGVKTATVTGNGTNAILNELEYISTFNTSVHGQWISKSPGTVGNSLLVLTVDAGNFTDFIDWQNSLASEITDFRKFTTYLKNKAAPSTTNYVYNRVSGSNSDREAKADEVHVFVLDATGLISGKPMTVLEVYESASKAIDAKQFDGTSNYYVDLLNNNSEWVFWGEHPEDSVLTSAANEIAWGNFVSDLEDHTQYQLTGISSIVTPGDDYEIGDILTVVGGTSTEAATITVTSVSREVTAGTPANGGTGYTVGDLLTVVGGVSGTPAILEVTNVTGGVIDTVSVDTAGTYTALPTNPVTVTGGTGTSATITLTFSDGGPIVAVSPTSGGRYTVIPSNPVSVTGGAGTAATFNLTNSYFWQNFKKFDTADHFVGAGALRLTGGVDGTTPSESQVLNAYNTILNPDLYSYTFIMTSDYNETIINHCIDNIAQVRKDCLVFLSPKDLNGPFLDPDTMVVDLLDYRNNINSSSYAVMDSGYKYQYDLYNQKYRWVPLNGDIAGLCARTDSEAEPWFSPAGYNRGQIKNISRLASNASQAERDELYQSGINPVVTFPGYGTVLFGDKTLQRKASAFDHINVRRLFIILEKSIAEAAKYQLFELNDAFTRNQFKALIDPFLRTVKGRRGLDDYRIICDESNNTEEVCARNEFIADIYIKPLYSINYIILNFIAVKSRVQFTQIEG